MQPIFRVMGFSVTGRVLNSVGGEGVPDATVSLNNQIKGNQKRRLHILVLLSFKSTKKLKACVFHISAILFTVLSKEDGSFRLENMTAGTYTIRVSKELMFFEPITVKIAPNTPQLPDIITAGCVCFSASHLGFSFFRTAD